METSQFIETCLEAQEFFDAKEQHAVAKETLAELIIAISHYERGRDIMREDLSEKTADAIICIQQLVFSANMVSQVDIHIDKKIDYLNKLMSN